MTPDDQAVAFVDVESTGLDPARHHLWEIALIVDDVERHWLIRPDLRTAAPAALRVNRYYQRLHAATPATWAWTAPQIAAAEIAKLTAGRHLVGACPWFDAAFLEPFLRANNQCPAWSHRHICVETLAAGRLGTFPTKLSETAAQLGIVVPDDDRHTALGDARTAKAVYDALAATPLTREAAGPGPAR